MPSQAMCSEGYCVLTTSRCPDVPCQHVLVHMAITPMLRWKHLMTVRSLKHSSVSSVMRHLCCYNLLLGHLTLIWFPQSGLYVA